MSSRRGRVGGRSMRQIRSKPVTRWGSLYKTVYTDDRLQYIPYVTPNLSIGFLVSKSIIDDDKYMKKRKRYLLTETEQSLIERFRSGNKTTTATPPDALAAAPLGAQLQPSPPLTIPRRVIREIIETHFSDGAISKGDNTYNPNSSSRL